MEADLLHTNSCMQLSFSIILFGALCLITAYKMNFVGD